MLAPFDIAVSAIGVCVVAMIMLFDFRSGDDVQSGIVAKLLVFAFAALWVLSLFRRKALATNELIPSREAQFDVSEHVELMKKYASERNIVGAMRTFRLMKQKGELSSLVYNTMLQAHINSGNMYAAEDWMDEIKEAGMADELSFHILVKALVTAHALQKAYDLLKEMSQAGVKPQIATFNEVLGGFARENQVDEALSLLEEMHTQGVEPTSVTLNAIVKLMNGSRHSNLKLGAVDRVLKKYNLEAITNGPRSVVRRASIDMATPTPIPLPCLSAVVSHSNTAKQAPCAHDVQVTGTLSEIKAVRRTLKQLGFLDKAESGEWPLDGHWETGHGLTVVIEGKIVRWSGRHASRLRFTNEDRTACVLSLYREATQGQLVQSTGIAATKTLRWNNGDIWYPCDGRAIGQHVLFTQTMTKTSRDEVQCEMYRARAKAVLKCVSKQALQMPAIFEETITQFLGNDLCYVRIHFESRWNPSKSEDAPHSDDEELSLSDMSMDVCSSISRRHPKIGLRHCWADKSVNNCGQRTLVNGDVIDEACFNRHIKAVTWA